MSAQARRDALSIAPHLKMRSASLGPRIGRAVVAKIRARLVPCVLCDALTTKRITADRGWCGCRKALAKAQGEAEIAMPTAWGGR